MLAQVLLLVVLLCYTAPGCFLESVSYAMMHCATKILIAIIFNVLIIIVLVFYFPTGLQVLDLGWALFSLLTRSSH